MRDFHHFLFFTGRIEADAIELDTEEARHAVAVLRCAPGDSIQVTDGAGTICECRIEAIRNRRLLAAVLGRTTCQRHGCPLHMIVGLPERDPFETLIHDLAALGVECITPLVAAHCQRPWWASWGGKLAERLRGKMIAGMKQSCYPFVPQLDPPVVFKDIGSALSGLVLMADAEGSSFSTVLDRIREEAEGPYSCIIGPPGGFSEEETTRLGGAWGAIGQDCGDETDHGACGGGDGE